MGNESLNIYQENYLRGFYGALNHAFVTRTTNDTVLTLVYLGVLSWFFNHTGEIFIYGFSEVSINHF